MHVFSAQGVEEESPLPGRDSAEFVPRMQQAVVEFEYQPVVLCPNFVTYFANEVVNEAVAAGCFNSQADLIKKKIVSVPVRCLVSPFAAFIGQLIDGRAVERPYAGEHEFCDLVEPGRVLSLSVAVGATPPTPDGADTCNEIAV